MKSTITTNLRLAAEEWAQIKAQAAELNLSANEYIIALLRMVSMRQELGYQPKTKQRKDAPIWKLGELASQKRSARNLSPEDEDIYGT